MARREEIRKELNDLYEHSRRALHSDTVKEYERLIDLREQELALIMD